MTGGKCKLPPCSDSDNGQNYQITGTTTGLMEKDADALGVPPITQDAQTYVDYCPFPSASYTNFPSLKSIVTEYYCYGLEVRARNYTCTSFGSGYDCQDGRCVPPTSN